MPTSCKSPRVVLFQTGRSVTTLLEMASEQARRMGRRIAERRKELGWTQRELAENIPAPKVTADYVSKWERGEHAPSDEHMPLLCAALEVDELDLRAGPIAERKPKTKTPDLMGTVNGDVPDDDLRQQLARIDQRLKRIEKILSSTTDHDLLEQINDAVATIQEATREEPQTATGT